ncbi:hypothetical protein BDN72DRAFT_748285, partial [Pluteus cervinus]
MALPKDLPTLEHRSSKVLTRPDNIFCSSGTYDQLIKCYTDPPARGPGADHFPILTIIDREMVKSVDKDKYNFRETDWKKFDNALTGKLATISISPEMEGSEIQGVVRKLTEAITDTIELVVPLVKRSPHSKRWWTRDLTNMKKEYNKLLKESLKFRELPDHPVHQKAKELGKEY